MSIVAVTAAEAGVLAELHATAFPPAEAWSATVISLQLGVPGAFGLADARGGLILARVIADEAEVLTLAVDPLSRRQGIARGLLSAAMAQAAAGGAGSMVLEVSVANPAARRLYNSAGFREVGRRRGYYADGTDALVMRAELARESAARNVTARESCDKPKARPR